MKTIGLKVDKAVIAYDPNGNGAGQHGGNVDVESGATLGWLCKNNGHAFLVRFYRFGTNAGIWPFVEPADHTEPDPTPGEPEIKYLRVQSTTTKTRTLNTFETLKYEVKVESGPTDAVPLDPTIIIRPGLRSIVAAGLPWAVAGAAVGALVTAVALME